MFKSFEANKMLFCDWLGSMVVYFTAVSSSHKCSDYHAVHYCAQTAQFFCQKKDEASQFLSGVPGSVTSLRMIP